MSAPSLHPRSQELYNACRAMCEALTGAARADEELESAHKECERRGLRPKVDAWEEESFHAAAFVHNAAFDLEVLMGTWARGETQDEGESRIRAEYQRAAEGRATAEQEIPL